MSSPRPPGQVPDEIEALAVETVMCARCEARPKQPCMTVTGRKSNNTHGARTTPLVRAFDLGFEEGRLRA